MSDVTEQAEVTPEQEQEQPPEVETQEPAPEEQAPPEGEEAKADDTEPAEGEAQPEEEPEAAKEAEEKKRRATGYQRKLLAREREIEALRAQLTQQQAKPAEPAKELAPEEKFQQLVRQGVQAELAAAREAEAQRAQAAEFIKRQEEFRSAHPDFDEALEDVAHVQLPGEVHQALLTSARAPEIMYSLAKNPAELARISALPPFQAALEVVRLEAKLASAAAPPAKPKAPIRPPAPPTSVKGSASSTRDPADLSVAEYKRLLRSKQR